MNRDLFIESLFYSLIQSNPIQAIKQLSSLSGVGRSPELDSLVKAMGVLQHHDAVSGTEKQHVADDYAERLSESSAAALGVMDQALR